jgi:hypothetical protein
MSKNNGRVTFPKHHENTFALYDKIPVHQCASFQDATLGLWEDTTLSKLYFSKENIQIIQNGIRAEVYRKSNRQYTIAPQDCDVLKVIMRSIFLQHAINSPTNITEQIQNLNTMVITYCSDNVLGEAQGYLKYLYDVTNLAVPMDRPVLTDINDKQLLLKEWF